MTIFQRVFDVFSRRPTTAAKVPHRVPDHTRRRILMWCEEVFSNVRAMGRGPDGRGPFWQEIHRFLRFKEGEARLSPFSDTPPSLGEDAAAYLQTCPAHAFLDFIEYIFRVESILRVPTDVNDLVSQVNELLRVEDLPYHLTSWVQEYREVPAGGRSQKTLRVPVVTAYPKIVMRESEVTHAEAVVPALQLLQRPHFSNVNTEFIAAMEDYRKGDYGDSLTKCGSAFESFMKVVCSRKGWPYNEKETAHPLIKRVIAHADLDNYFEQPLLIIATLRNRVSTAHGAGTVKRSAPPTWPATRSTPLPAPSSCSRKRRASRSVQVSGGDIAIYLQEKSLNQPTFPGKCPYPPALLGAGGTHLPCAQV